MKKSYHKILRTTTGTTYNLPVYLNSTAYEMGGMVGFDGDIEQVEQLTNFHYSHTGGNSIRLYNTVNRDALKIIKNQTFTIKWGDGNTQSISVSSGNPLSYVQYTFPSAGTYEVSIEIDNNWVSKKLTKKITVPQDNTVTNPNGTFGPFTIPYTNVTTSQAPALICSPDSAEEAAAGKRLDSRTDTSTSSFRSSSSDIPSSRQHRQSRVA